MFSRRKIEATDGEGGRQSDPGSYGFEWGVERDVFVMEGVVDI